MIESSITNKYLKKFILCLSLFVACSYTQAMDKPRLRVITSIGSFTIELYPKKAPLNVANILQHVDAGFYNNIIFHRVIKNFIVQAGAYDQQKTLLQPLTGTVHNEADNGLKNLRASVAMARTAHPHSARAQFFISINNNPHLNHSAKSDTGWGYTVIGKVKSGMNIVRRMSRVATDSNRFPIAPVVIKRISRI